ncbi:MAG: MBL fold metallo-hydrolase [Planctomycetia bacterium]|nr:MBL fold metallo-hydrolase [Planctomycetia bacterium]
MDNIIEDTSRVARFDAGHGVHIYRIPCQVLPHLSGYVHLVRGPGISTTLFDAGSSQGHSTPDILAGFDQIHSHYEPFYPEQIDRIILTHAHVDHFGGLSELRRLTGAEVWVHASESRTVCSFNERATVFNLRASRMCRECGLSQEETDAALRHFGFLPGRVAATPVDRIITDRMESDGLSFHHLPGHSAGHLAIVFGNYLFTGDILLSKTLTQIWPERLIPQTGIGHYLESLERLGELADQVRLITGQAPVLMTGHEEVVTRTGERIELVRKSEHRRNERIITLLQNAEEPPTARQLFRKMYLTAQSSRMFFGLCDVVARLEFLQQQGRVAVVDYDRITEEQPEFHYAAC